MVLHRVNSIVFNQQRRVLGVVVKTTVCNFVETFWFVMHIDSISDEIPENSLGFIKIKKI